MGLLLGEFSPEPEQELEPGLWLSASEGQADRGSRLVPSWQRGAGVTQEDGSWKGRRRCSRAGLVPETGRPRFLSCCRNSDTWREGGREGGVVEGGKEDKKEGRKEKGGREEERKSRAHSSTILNL